MSVVGAIKTALLTAGTPFAIVGGATALARVKDRPTALPAAFVLTAKEVSGENERATGPVLQRVERDIMVVIVAEDLSDENGDATSDELETLIGWVRDQLVGLVPVGMEEPITHVGGEIVETRAGAAWFEDTFSAPYYREGQP